MAKRKAAEPEDPIVAEARDRWNRCDEAEDAQRKSILEAKNFRAGDQWPAAVRLQREGAGSIQGQANQPPRPCLTIDRLSPPVRQVSNQIKQANFAIDVLPRGFGADTDTADLFKGYIRRVQMEAKAESPIEWAAEGAAEGGLGWFRIRTEYVHETWDGDPADPAAYDQEVRLERIANNLTVYCDPSANKPTRSDAQFMLVTEDLSKEEFKRRWPKADYAGLEQFAATGDNHNWVSDSSIRIAEYWRITYEDKPITDGKQARTIRAPKVEGYKINAVEVLEQWDWVGSRIPLIPILGEELNVDGKVVLRGIIQEGMDAQRMVNYTYSGAMEIFALGNKSPYIVEESQLGSYAPIWQTANLYNYSHLPYIHKDGAPPPKRDMSEAPIQAAVQLMLKSEEAIKATTSVYDPSLEYNNPREHSGEAIKALQAQSDIASSGYGQSVGRALTYAGSLMVEIIPKITRVGQLLQIIGVDDEPQAVLVGQPFQKGPDGQPVPSQVTPEQAKLSKGLHQFYDLKNGRYAVQVAVGKSSATRREEGAQALGNLIPHLPPEMAAVATPDFVEQLSFPGAHKIAEKLKKALPPQLQEQDENGPDPRLVALQQQNQQLQQALQSKVAEKQAEVQAKGQIDMQITQMELQSKERIALIQASTTLNATQAKIDAEDARTFVDAMENRLSSALDLHMQKLGMVHEAMQQGQKHAHEHATAVELATMQHEQALAAGEQAHAQGLEAGAQQHGQALDQMAQQAALAPDPAQGAGA